jgi:hypothetical protein
MDSFQNQLATVLALDAWENSMKPLSYIYISIPDIIGKIARPNM